MHSICLTNLIYQTKDAIYSSINNPKKKKLKLKWKYLFVFSNTRERERERSQEKSWVFFCNNQTCNTPQLFRSTKSIPCHCFSRAFLLPPPCSLSLSLLLSLSSAPLLMASIAGSSPTTSATNLSGPTRRRLQELDPEKDEELYEAHDIYHPARGSIHVLKALFEGKSSSSNSTSSRSASRISKQMWQRAVLLLFVMAAVGVLTLSQIGGRLGQRTSFLHHQMKHDEMLSLNEEVEVKLMSLQRSIRKKSMVCSTSKIFYHLSVPGFLF